MKRIFRMLAHMVFGIRRFNDKSIKIYAKGVENKKILEIGSGKHEYGKDYYSAKRYFSSSNEFIQSDVNPEYGHQIIDITSWAVKEKYDVIICMNVLEHVFEYQKAIDNLYRALKKGGELVVFVPMIYPLHDEPHDYWRFTEHSLRKMLNGFCKVEVNHSGIHELPVAYFIISVK